MEGLDLKTKGQEKRWRIFPWYKVSDFICGVERGWILLLITIVWWACSAEGMWRMPRGRVLWGHLGSQAEKRQENATCDSESSLTDTPQARPVGILLGMTGNSQSWLCCPACKAASWEHIWGKCSSA